MGSGLTYAILPGKEINPVEWDTFIDASPQGSIFALHGYASCVAPDWEAMIIYKDRQWYAVMPFLKKIKWKWKASTLPAFVQYWGMCYGSWYPDQMYKQLSEKKKCLQIALQHFSSFHLFDHRFSTQFNYPLPFHWDNYQLRNKYTYQLALHPDINALYKGLGGKLRNELKKAEKAQIQIIEAEHTTSFLHLFQLQEQSGKTPLGNQVGQHLRLKHLSEWLIENDLGKVMVAIDRDGQTLAGALLIRYKGHTIYLAGAYDPKFHQTGAMSWLLWQSIISAKHMGDKIFDFEGSMIESIEAFYRRFGAYPVNYLEIRRNRLPLLIRWIREYT